MNSWFRSVSVAMAAAVVGVVAVPAIASADATSTVLTYVQIINRSGSQIQPSSFIVTARGFSATPSTFAGSLQGTKVSFDGDSDFSLRVDDSHGLTAEYSQGCSGHIAPGQQHLCVITLSNPSATFPGPIPNLLPVSYARLQCSPQYQTVGAGTTVSFVALGGNGTYTWNTVERSNLNAGPVFSTAFGITGTQAVTVTSGAQSSTCTVQVVANGPIAYSGSVPMQGGVPPMGGAVLPMGGNAPYVSLSQTPRLPNTGIAPLSAAQFAFASVALLGLMLVAFPYVRKSLGHIFS